MFFMNYKKIKNTFRLYVLYNIRVHVEQVVFFQNNNLQSTHDNRRDRIRIHDPVQCNNIIVQSSPRWSYVGVYVYIYHYYYYYCYFVLDMSPDPEFVGERISVGRVRIGPPRRIPFPIIFGVLKLNATGSAKFPTA